MPTITTDHPNPRLLVHAARCALLAAQVERDALREQSSYTRECLQETAGRLRQADVTLRTLARLSHD